MRRGVWKMSVQPVHSYVGPLCRRTSRPRLSGYLRDPLSVPPASTGPRLHSSSPAAPSTRDRGPRLTGSLEGTELKGVTLGPGPQVYFGVGSPPRWTGPPRVVGRAGPTTGVSTDPYPSGASQTSPEACHAGARQETKSHGFCPLVSCRDLCKITRKSSTRRTT